MCLSVADLCATGQRSCVCWPLGPYRCVVMLYPLSCLHFRPSWDRRFRQNLSMLPAKRSTPAYLWLPVRYLSLVVRSVSLDRWCEAVTDLVEVLRPTRHKTGHSGELLPQPVSWYNTEETEPNNKSQQPHHTLTTVLRPFFRDHPGEPVPEENFWTLWCKG